MTGPPPRELRPVDRDFVGLPLHELADAALEQARREGAAHAELRVERTRESGIRVRDRQLEGAADSESFGLSVRVVHDGTWGFAATTSVSAGAAAMAAREAVEVARTSAAIRRERIELADEPIYRSGTWVSSYDVNPFEVASADRTAVLLEWTSSLLAQRGVDHADATVLAVQEDKFYADLAGTTTTQERVRIHPAATAVSVDERGGGFETMRTLAPPVGRGWEYMTGTGWDWGGELATLGDLLAEKVAAPSVRAGDHDVVIDPSNLWLTIHESIGHATELDRALGYEAAYAGTSFATFDRLGTLRYGSPIMHVTGDRTVDHGLATVGWDDEGVAAQSWDLVRDGIFVGYQLDRRMAARQGFSRSNGCAFADSSGHVPIQRMANVSLQPAPGGPTTAELIGEVADGIYIVGDRSWSIDMQRFNFQFTRAAVLPDQGRPPGRTVAGRGVPGRDHRVLGIYAGGRRRVDLCPRGCVQLREGSAGPGCPGESWLPLGIVSWGAHSQHHPGGGTVTGLRVSPQVLVERALELSTADGCVVIADEVTDANLRWANNTLTTNGITQADQLTVISVVGRAVGVVSRGGVTMDSLESLVRMAEDTARTATEADDEMPFVTTGTGGGAWDQPPGRTSIRVFEQFSADLGEAFRRASAADELLFGYAEHELRTTYVASSAGLRARHDQPTGHVEFNAKSADFERSAWAGRATVDFSDVDLIDITQDLSRRLGWAARRIDLPPGRYETILPPSAVADLMIDLYHSAGGRDAHDGRTAFSRPGGGTRVGEHLGDGGVTLRSDPAAPFLNCSPFLTAHASSAVLSVFDNGIPLGPTSWITDGVLTALIQTRRSAALSGLPVTPYIDNLIMDGPASGPNLDDLVAGSDRALLLTSLWYIREVDPQTMLLTGLTRDGVYLVDGGEVVGAVNNFRFNESPLDLLRRILDIGASVRTLPREWAGDFTRIAMPPLRVDGFNMSSVSQAS